MEIISKLIEIEVDLPTDNNFIEAKLNEMNIKPLRWAIVKCGSRCEPVSACQLQAEQGEHDDSDVRVFSRKLHRSIKNKVTLTISLACKNV